MGGDQVTVDNLEVVEINHGDSEIYVKGAVPGARNGFISIKTIGELKIVKWWKRWSKEETVVVEELKKK